jgi:hypothetical protein
MIKSMFAIYGHTTLSVPNLIEKYVFQIIKQIWLSGNAFARDIHWEVCPETANKRQNST